MFKYRCESGTTIKSSLFSATMVVGVALFGSSGEAQNATDTVNELTSGSAHVAASTKEEIGPALWKASDDDTTVYLFGTIHLLKPGTNWKTADFKDAFKSSDAVYLEADVGPGAQAKIAPLVQSRGLFQDGRTLSGVLGDNKAVVEKAATKVGIPLTAMDPMKPWLAGLQMSVKQLIDSGYAPGQGVDQAIAASANNIGKPLRYLETPEEQLLMLSSFPEEGQVAFLVRSSERIDEGSSLLDKMVGAWQTADIDQIGELMGSGPALGSPLAYERIIVDRNKNWTEQITELMANEAGTFLIAVGTAHLAGDDSVIKMLEAKGTLVERQ